MDMMQSPSSSPACSAGESGRMDRIKKSVFRDFLLNGHADPHQEFPR